MTFTITITKLRLAIAIVAIGLLVPATAAVATQVFDDVPDGRFYSEAVAWAFDNNITTGTTATTFEPDAGVTRGQNVTFAKRYDDNIVQPALASVAAAQPFAVSAFVPPAPLTSLTTTPMAYVTVAVTAPVDGNVTVNSTAAVGHSSDGGDVRCILVEATNIPATSIQIDEESAQWHETGGASDTSTLAGTRTFAISSGARVEYVLACEELADGGFMNARNLTAIFTPAP
jgi:hypothetical protein